MSLNIGKIVKKVEDKLGIHPAHSHKGLSNMTQDDSVQAGQDAIKAALAQCYQDGVSSVDKGISADQESSDIGAVKAQDAAAMQSAQDAASKAMSDLQSKFDDLSKKEGAESAIVSGLQGGLATLKSAFDALSAAVSTASTPASGSGDSSSAQTPASNSDSSSSTAGPVVAPVTPGTDNVDQVATSVAQDAQ